MGVTTAYLGFVPLAALCFVLLPPRAAILTVLIGGWWALPVERYALDASSGVFPWWLTGIALPGERLLTKAWVPPLVAFTGAALRDPAALRRWRPAAIDLPMAAWCLWPLVDGGVGADPPPLPAAAYVAGAWGLPWLIGRVWLGGSGGNLALIRGLALSGLANLPAALIEGARPAMLYGLVYGAHPFRTDGIERYLGYRPLGFFEDGNLYGLWAALAALAGVWLARRDQGRGGGWTVLAAVDVGIALASQSVGAIALLVAGLALLAVWRSPLVAPALAGVAALLLLVAAVHLSGVVPLQRMKETPAGQRVINAMRATGRGSFLWRVSQDTKTLPGIAAHPVTGSARWDWFRPYGTRPWGQALLLIGQYGLIGVALAWGGLVAAALGALARARGTPPTADAALPLALVVLLALADATLNAFFFSPAIVAAGAIALRPRRRSPGSTVER